MPLTLPTIRNPSDPSMAEIRRAFKQLDDPWLDRKEARASLTAGTPVAVRHGLSFIPQHWLIVDKTAQADVWRTSATSDALLFDCSADVDVVILFW